MCRGSVHVLALGTGPAPSAHTGSHLVLHELLGVLALLVAGVLEVLGEPGQAHVVAVEEGELRTQGGCVWPRRAHEVGQCAAHHISKARGQRGALSHQRVVDVADVVLDAAATRTSTVMGRWWRQLPGKRFQWDAAAPCGGAAGRAPALSLDLLVEGGLALGVEVDAGKAVRQGVGLRTQQRGRGRATVGLRQPPPCAFSPKPSPRAVLLLTASKPLLPLSTVASSALTCVPTQREAKVPRTTRKKPHNTTASPREPQQPSAARRAHLLAPIWLLPRVRLRADQVPTLPSNAQRRRARRPRQ